MQCNRNPSAGEKDGGDGGSRSDGILQVWFIHQYNPLVRRADVAAKRRAHLVWAKGDMGTRRKKTQEGHLLGTELGEHYRVRATHKDE